ncbi:hypothetical protein BC831DRAFT_439867 [Entophlyctis helioformis]|nr:hypothetical protein BC831DRAFT_439867 [Entophlyctis helioformis]
MDHELGDGHEPSIELEHVGLRLLHPASSQHIRHVPEEGCHRRLIRRDDRENVIRCWHCQCWCCQCCCCWLLRLAVIIGHSWLGCNWLIVGLLGGVMLGRLQRLECTALECCTLRQFHWVPKATFLARVVVSTPSVHDPRGDALAKDEPTRQELCLCYATKALDDVLVADVVKLLEVDIQEAVPRCLAIKPAVDMVLGR